MKGRSGWTVGILAAGLVAATLTGCKPDAAIRQGAVVDSGRKQPTAALDPLTLGTVSGTVSLLGKAPTPARIDMSLDPACGSGGGDNYSEQYVVHDGRLANVYLYIKSGPPMVTASVSSNRAVIDQKGCRYVPHVIAIQRGDFVEFRNSDMTMHTVHIIPANANGKQLDVAQGPKGAPQIVPFRDAAIMMPVRCDPHPWMNAFINVADTPFYAVTDGNGHFEIKGLPAGRYELAAVHERLGEQTISITVKPQEIQTADFKYAMK
jgi:plastocyanin